MLLKCYTQYASKFGKLSHATGLEKRIPKKGNAKECSNYHTIVLISHASKVMLKNLQASPAVHEPKMCELRLEKAEELEVKLLTFVVSYRKQGNSRKTSTSALLTT